MSHPYLPETITRAQADALAGATVLQFGTDWCGFCRAAEEPIESVLGDAGDLRRIFVEDGSGRPLGRSYQVRRWPTLIFLAHGTEVARVVRPESSDDVADALAWVTKLSA